MAKIKKGLLTFVLLFCLLTPNITYYVHAIPDVITTNMTNNINIINTTNSTTNSTSWASSLDDITINGTSIEGFDSDTLEYVVTLPSNTTLVEIDASKTSSRSSIEGTGSFQVSSGNQYTYEIVVTAEDGTIQTYTITIIIDTKPTVFITYNGVSLGFEVDLDNIKVPKNFVETTITYDNQEFKAWKHKNEEKNLVLIYLSNNDIKSFYIYENGAVVSIYHQFIINDEIYEYYGIPTELLQQTGFTYKEDLVVREYTLSGWNFKESKYSNYYLLYLANEHDVFDYYVFGIKTDKIMTLSAFNLVQEQQNSRHGITFYAAVGGITLVFVSFLGYLFYMHKKKNRKIKMILRNIDKEIFDDLPITHTRRKG